MQQLESFKPEKEYLICIDSDGCAMDTMDIKHKKCFGPCMIEVWHLQEWEEQILTRWYEINLYTQLRGINRFKGLGLALKEINEQYTQIEGLDLFLKWVEETKELSNQSLLAQMELEKKADHSVICLEKALEWSNALNQRIKELLPEEKLPFANVLEGLKKAQTYADIAIVSSANYEAVYEEWSENGLLDSVDLLLSQNIGSKAYCIEQLAKKGYEKSHILMIGDAPGDEKAASVNTVYFYPILVRHEAESWKELVDHALDKFIQQDQFSQYAAEQKEKFYHNLGR